MAAYGQAPGRQVLNPIPEWAVKAVPGYNSMLIIRTIVWDKDGWPIINL